MYTGMCLHTQQESRFGGLEKEFSFPLPVAQVEHGGCLSLHQRAVQKNLTGKLCRTTFLHAVVDMLQEGSSRMVKLIINEYVKEEKWLMGEQILV